MESMSDRRRSIFQDGKAYGELVFDPKVNLCMTRPGNTLHMTRESLLYAMALFEGEAAEELDRGRRIVDAVLSTQDLNEESGRFGSFKWNWEDPQVDPPTGNTAKFLCPSLVHIGMVHSRKLGEERTERVRRSLAAAARASLTQGFNVDYANIALLACLSLIAAGEWLQRKDIEETGNRTLGHFISHMNELGGPSEYNSPTYSFVDLLAVAWLRKLSGSDEVKLKTRLLEDRIWLQLACHYHPPTGLLGGPYSRAYQNDVTGACSLVGIAFFLELGLKGLWNPERNAPYDMSHNNLWGVPAALIDFHLSEPTRLLFHRKAYPYVTCETTDSVANRVERSLITTYQTARYSLGTAGRGYHYIDQAVSFSLHYLRPGSRPGIVYSRLRLGDQRYGSFHFKGLDSTKSNDYDRGTLYSVQKDSRCVGLYALPRPFETDKVCIDLVWPDTDGAREVWVGGRSVTSLPQEFAMGETICIRDGEVFLGVKAVPDPREADADGAPGSLHIADGSFHASFYLYRGPRKAFARADLVGGFAAEAGDASLRGGFDSFRRHCAQWIVTNGMRGGRIREAGLSCGHGSVELRYDVELERIVDRHADGRSVSVSTLDSPTIRQGRGGLLKVGRSRLEVNPDVSAILAADDESLRYAVVNPEQWATPITLSTPHAELCCRSFTLGRIDLSVAGTGKDRLLEVRMDTLYQLEPVEVRAKLRHCRIFLNGREMSSRLKKREPGRWVLPAEFPKPPPGASERSTR